MRVLLINTLYPPLQIGGAEKSVGLLAEALARSGDSVAVISLHPEDDEAFEQNGGVRIYRLPLDNRYWPFGRKERGSMPQRFLWHLGDAFNREAARRVGDILDRERPEVVHTNNLLGFSVSVWNEIKARNIRLVHTLRDYYLLCPRCTVFRHGAICESRCVECVAVTANRKPASSMPDAVIANSAYVLEKHRRHGYFDGVPSSVIYNVADTDLAVPPRPRPPGDHSLVLGFIGKIEPEKGIEVALEATRLIRSPNWRLRIAGSGYRAYIDDLQRRFPDPRIEWLGFTAAREFYASIDISLIPSIWAEPLPRTLIESFAAGKSAICAASGGTPEIVPLGKVVELYSAQDPSALGAAIDRAFADQERWRSGGPAYPGALDIFSESAIATRYRAVYNGEEQPGLERPIEEAS
jgi:glycosyltransferase involved in cell wall biosynthesis